MNKCVFALLLLTACLAGQVACPPTSSCDSACVGPYDAYFRKEVKVQICCRQKGFKTGTCANSPNAWCNN